MDEQNDIRTEEIRKEAMSTEEAIKDLMKKGLEYEEVDRFVDLIIDLIAERSEDKAEERVDQHEREWDHGRTY